MDQYLSNKFINTVSDFEYYSCKFSPFVNGLVATAQSQYYGIVGNGRICVYNFDFNNKNIQEIKRFNTNDGCFDIAWSEVNENIIASAQGDGTLKIWDLKSQFPVCNLSSHAGEVFSVNWNINSTELLLSSGRDMTVKLHDLNKMATVNTYLGHKGVVYNAVWHPTQTGIFASCSEDGSFKIWDLKSYEPIKSIKAHNCHAMSCDFNKYDNILATAGSDGTLALWDLRGSTNIPLFAIKAHSLTIKKICFNPFNSSILSTVGYDMNIRLWDTKLCQQIDILKHHKEFIFGNDFSVLQDNLMATCGWDRTLSIFNWKDIKVINNL